MSEKDEEYYKTHPRPLLGYTDIHKKIADDKRKARLQIDTLTEVQNQLEEDRERKQLQQSREEEIFSQVSELSKRGDREYQEYIATAKEKMQLELETAKNYEEMSRIILAQAKREFADFKRRAKKNRAEMKGKGVTVSKNSVFDTVREEALRKAKKEAKLIVPLKKRVRKEAVLKEEEHND